MEKRKWKSKDKTHRRDGEGAEKGMSTETLFEGRLKRMGDIKPKKCAGHGMPCRYENRCT